MRFSRFPSSPGRFLGLTPLLLAASLLVGARVHAQPAVTSPEEVAVPTVFSGQRGTNVPTHTHFLTWSPGECEVGFRKVAAIAPGEVRVVRRGNHVRPLPRARGPELPVRFEYRGESLNTAAFREKYRASGILIIHQGEVVLEHYGLGRRPEDPWISFSVTKSITSTLLGAALRDGAIRSLDDTVDRYVDEMRDSVYSQVTLRHLLTMSSGVKWNENYDDPDSDVAKAGYLQFPGEPSPMLAYLRRLRREQPPGEAFRYSTGETDLAGFIVSRATRTPLAEYLSRKIWAPYGMEQDATWLTDAAGHERGGCCLSMTLSDFARFGLFILENGTGTLPEDWIREATRPRLPVSRQFDLGGYGYFWWVHHQVFQALGVFGQMIHIDPAHQLVIVINSAWPDPVHIESHLARAAFVQAATEAALARRKPAAPLPIPDPGSRAPR